MIMISKGSKLTYWNAGVCKFKNDVCSQCSQESNRKSPKLSKFGTVWQVVSVW